MQTHGDHVTSRGKKSAFTLIELLAAVAILGVLSMGLLGFLGNFLNLKMRAEAKLRMREEGEYALDRIEYLIRNSITLPDICGREDAGIWKSFGDLYEEKGNRCVVGSTDYCRNPYSDTIKFNLRGDRSLLSSDYVHGMRVFLDGSELYEVSTYDHSRGHGHGNTNGEVKGDDGTYNLTKSNPGSTGNGDFTVSNADSIPANKIVQCVYDPYFLHGYNVHITFKITYKRRSTNSNEPTLTEVFSRDVSVRNTAQWQKD